MLRLLRLTAVSSVCFAVATAQTEWQRLPLLEHVRYPAFAFDIVRDTVVMFGGETDAGLVGRTWLKDRTTWRQPGPAHGPSARQQAAMVFDPVRCVTMLFGGRGSGSSSNMLGDTWTWDGHDWTQLSPAHSPSARALSVMVWDAARGVTLLFGGRSATVFETNDTWEWNGADWTQRNPLHRPPPRAGAAMSCDTVRQRVVLFGGSCFQLGPCWRGDTWEWDGVDWTDRSPPYPVPAPLPRWSHGMAFDPARGRTVLFGGSDEPVHYSSDTWEWNGVQWVEVATTVRPGRLGFGICYDPVAQRVLAFGGEDWVGLKSDLWSFDGVDWQRAHPGMQPKAMFLPRTEAVTFDGDRAVVLWYGHFLYATEPRQTWEWNGESWRLAREGSGPMYPESHRLAWLPVQHRVVLYQPARLPSASDETWAYDGVQWAQLQPAHQPGTRAGFDLALESGLNRLLLFGGRDAQGLRGSTWAFDGVDWQQVASTGPSPREHHAMALDLRRGRVVLFGGGDGSAVRGDTFEWNGQQWQQLQPAHAPPARQDHAMTYDLARQRVVLHGGTGSSGWLADTWEWDGVDWLQRPTTSSMLGNFGHFLTYDLCREGTIAVGGIRDGTWRYAPVHRGELATFGRACGGSLGAPGIRTPLGERPYTGGPFTVWFTNLPGPLAFAAAGFSSTTWNGMPLPHNLQSLGYPACYLLVEPALTVVLPVSSGVAEWILPLPATAAAVGLTFYQQALAFDPAGPAGLAVTPGVEAVVGGR